MSKLLQMQKKRADLAAQMRTIVDAVDSEKGMTQEQEQQWNQMDAEIQALDKSIKTLEAQVALENRLDQYEPAGREVPGGGAPSNPMASSEYLANYESYVRAGFTPEISAALTVGTDTEGGFTVPESWAKTLIGLLTDAVVMRQLGTVISTDSTINLPLVSDNGAAGWLAEGAAYPESDIEFGSAVLAAHKLGRIMKVSEELLQDSGVNLESEIGRIFAATFGLGEDAAFVAGDGTGKPTGVITTAVTGRAAASATAITYDEVVDLVHSVREVYRMKSNFLLKDSTCAMLRKLKSADGVPLWQPSLQAGKPDQFLGYNTRTSEFMPAVATGNKTIAFGDFSNYRIADRGGMVMQRLNEKYADTGHVGFKMRKRVDGKLLVAESVKVLVQA